MTTKVATIDERSKLEKATSHVAYNQPIVEYKFKGDRGSGRCPSD